MKTFLLVRSEYYELDSSKYRLGITANTLIPSLQNQTSKDFHVVLTMSPMDPQWTKRRNLFKTCGVPIIDDYKYMQEVPALEITVGDDDFLCANFIQVMQRVQPADENRALCAPNGYVFSDGELHIWRHSENVVEGIQWVEQDNANCHKAVIVSEKPGWVYVRHKMNSNMIPIIRGIPVAGLNWPGWQPRVLEKVSGIRIVTATAQGSEHYPHRSRSVVYAKGSFRKRRKGL